MNCSSCEYKIFYDEAKSLLRKVNKGIEKPLKTETEKSSTMKESPKKGKDCLTIKELTEELKCSRWLITKFMREDDLPYINLGRRKLVDRVDLETWLENRTQGGL